MPETLPLFDHAQILKFGFRFSTRMTVLPLGSRQLALVSPVPIDAARAAAVEALGDVAFLIAPNLLHHLYLADAVRRYPNALVLAPPGLRAKRPDLRVDGSLADPLPAELAAAVDVVRIEGAPRVDEFAIHHRATRTLVLTDLVFNVTHPRGWLAHAVLFLAGCHGRLASSRAWRLFVQDRTLTRASVARMLALPFSTLVMAHGDVVTESAVARLGQALRWLDPKTARLPEAGAHKVRSSSR
jgi:hypothetical protein